MRDAAVYYTRVGLHTHVTGRPGPNNTFSLRNTQHGRPQECQVARDTPNERSGCGGMSNPDPAVGVLRPEAIPRSCGVGQSAQAR